MSRYFCKVSILFLLYVFIVKMEGSINLENVLGEIPEDYQLESRQLAVVEDFCRENEELEKGFKKGYEAFINYCQKKGLSIQSEKLTCKKTKHYGKECLNCFTTIEKKTYGFRLYESGKIEVGIFSRTWNNKLSNGFWGDTEKEQWKNIDETGLLYRFKEQKNKLFQKLAINKCIKKNVVECYEVFKQKKDKIDEITKCLGHEKQDLAKIFGTLIDNAHDFVTKEKTKGPFKARLEEAISNLDKFNSCCNLCHCF